MEKDFKIINECTEIDESGKQTIDVKVLCEKLAVIYADTLREGVVIGMKDGSIIIGTKKEEERTAATVRPQNELFIG